MLGAAWMLATASVFFRDVPNVVGVALTLLFYVTPVFYSLRVVPEQFQWVLQVNPLATFLEGYRSAVLGDPLPGLGRILGVTVVAITLAAVGQHVLRRYQPRFSDYL
jgi:ABC-type polysaccharide/polyol phosphate export permease